MYLTKPLNFSEKKLCQTVLHMNWIRWGKQLYRELWKPRWKHYTGIWSHEAKQAMHTHGNGYKINMDISTTG